MNLKEFFKPNFQKILAGLFVFFIALLLCIIGLASNNMLLYHILLYIAFPVSSVTEILVDFYGTNVSGNIVVILVWSVSWALTIFYWYVWGCILFGCYNRMKTKDKKK